MLRNVCLNGFALVLAALLTVSAFAETKNGHRSAAAMSGRNGMCAKAEFEHLNVKGKISKKLVVMIDHAKPNTAYNVFVRDEKVGTIQTNQNGKGRLELRSGFPKPNRGDCIRIGPMSGVVVDEDDGDSNDDGGGTPPPPPPPPAGDPAPAPVPTGYQVQGELMGYGNNYGTVMYTEKMESGVLNRSLEIIYDDAIPMHLLFVGINGDVWLNLMTDDAGHVHFQMQTNPPADSTDIDPMPVTFPSIHAGDVLTVGYGGTTMVLTATYSDDAPPVPPAPPAPPAPPVPPAPSDDGSVGDGSNGDGEHCNHDSSDHDGRDHDRGKHKGNDKPRGHDRD